MLSLKEICHATEGICNYQNQDLQISSVTTDTRNITENSLFIALKGEQFDGHDFIEQASEKGAKIIISEKEIQCKSIIIKVNDSKKALADIAKYYRNKFDVNIVGITGSVGKTSTKDMVSCVLSKKMNTLKTQGNLNNEIGLPITLLKLNEQNKAAVIEMGMSDLGEISYLSQITTPDISIITNIGYSHIENLKTRDNILKAKLEILDGMKENTPVILNADDDLLSGIKLNNFKVFTYGIENKNSNIYADNIKSCEFSEEFDICYQINGITGKISAAIPAKGKHNILNSLAAFGVGILNKMTAEEIVEAYKDYQPSSMRQNILKKGEQTVIIDCYNASPTSMRAALSVLSEMKGNRKIAVLSDMLELGDMSRKLHEEVAEYAKELKVDLLLLHGEMMMYCNNKSKVLGINSLHFKNKHLLSSYLKENVKNDDILLFKASRSMKLEDVISEVWE